MKTQMTLLELSNILVGKGFADIFDAQIDECLNIKEMKGSWADDEGEEIIYFNIIEIDEESGHLNTVISIDE